MQSDRSEVSPISIIPIFMSEASYLCLYADKVPKSGTSVESSQASSDGYSSLQEVANSLSDAYKLFM